MDITLRLPAGHTAMGAPNPNAVQDATGAWFFGLNTKVRGGSYGFRVYRQVAGTSASECLSVQGLGGQGQIQLQGDGTLSACAFVAPGDQQLARVVMVAEFVPLGARGGAIAGVVPCRPARWTSAIAGQTFRGVQQINLVALFDLPGPIVSADVRFTAAAARSDIRARLGGESDPWQLTPFVQVAHQAIALNGTVYPEGGRTLRMSVVPDGEGAQLWLNLLAYTPAA